MRLVLWFVGVFQILGGLMVCRGMAPAWCWMWVALGVLWLFVGVGLLVSWLFSLIKPRLGGLTLKGPGQPNKVSPPVREDR